MKPCHLIHSNAQQQPDTWTVVRECASENSQQVVRRNAWPAGFISVWGLPILLAIPFGPTPLGISVLHDFMLSVDTHFKIYSSTFPLPPFRRVGRFVRS